jgi:hypothetical protein
MPNAAISRAMLDAIFILSGFAFFALAILYTYICDQL